MSHPNRETGLIHRLQELSVPLLAGVAAALVHANLSPQSYRRLVEHCPFGDAAVFGHPLSIQFLINDVFMVFFFGLAAKEITESCLPGGALNPPRKALNPLLATLGGVLGPIGVFFAALYFTHAAESFPERYGWGQLARGWGVPTATDIALAWLVARAVFGAGHPAINFLLLLAVADDGIGLAIIALFYGDPLHPAVPAWLLLVLAGAALALGLRVARVRSWLPYIALGGPLAWLGLVLANLHPALALVFIVPFLPGKGDVLVGPEEDAALAEARPRPHLMPLDSFAIATKPFVDFGLFFFAYANAGVELAGVGPMTWIILGSLVAGKTAGITLFGLLATRLGFPLPDRMGTRELLLTGFIGGLGLTVALFVAGAAFADLDLQGQAKMGALFSGLVGLAAVAIGRLLRLNR